MSQQDVLQIQTTGGNEQMVRGTKKQDVDETKTQERIYKNSVFSCYTLLPWESGCSPSPMTKMVAAETEERENPPRLDGIHAEKRAVFSAADAPALPGEPAHDSRASLPTNRPGIIGTVGTRRSVFVLVSGGRRDK